MKKCSPEVGMLGDKTKVLVAKVHCKGKLDLFEKLQAVQCAQGVLCIGMWHKT